MAGIEKKVIRNREGQITGTIERRLTLEDEIAWDAWPDVRAQLSRAEILAVEQPVISLRLGRRYAGVDARDIVKGLENLIINDGFARSRWRALSWEW